MVGLDGQVSGHWLSANKSVITVETDSGQSEAVGEGSTQGTNAKHHHSFDFLVHINLK